MSKPKRSRKSKQGRSYELQHTKRTASSFVLTIYDNIAFGCSVTIHPNKLEQVSNKRIDQAVRFLKRTSKGKRTKHREKKAALKTLQVLTGITLSELSKLAEFTEGNIAIISASADSLNGALGATNASDKTSKKAKNSTSKKSKKKGKKHSKNKKARSNKSERNLVPSEISRKLGKKATKRVEKLLRSAIERELSYVLEQEARKWTRQTVEAAGIGDCKVSGTSAGNVEKTKPLEPMRNAANQDAVSPLAEVARSVSVASPAKGAEQEQSARASQLTVDEPAIGEKAAASETSETHHANSAPKAKEQAVLEFLTEHPLATQSNIAEALQISRSTVADYTAALQAKGLLAREGSRRAGRWVIPG